MGIFGGGKKVNLDSLSKVSGRNILESVLKATSGADVSSDLSYSIYYKIIGFKACKGGIGCSLLVADVAMALAKLGLTVCVLDTSVRTPSQDVLLNTGNTSEDDWLEMPYTNSNVVSVSKRNSKIHVLSFRNRGIVDLLSVSENEELCNVAFTQLLDKYDIFLVDLSNEPSAVATACMQHCHKVIQLWTNAPHALNNISKFVEDNVAMCCPLEKMSSVVTSMVVDDIPTDWDSILEKYKFKRIGNIPISLDVARLVALGKLPFDYQANSKGIELYNKCISDVVNDIINVEVGEVENFTGRTLEDIVTEEYFEEDESDSDILEDDVLEDSPDDSVDDFDLDVDGEVDE